MCHPPRFVSIAMFVELWYSGSIYRKKEAREMKQFLQWTAWTMEKPAAYGLFHISFSLILLAITVLSAWGLRKVNEKGNRVILGAVGAFLLATEVYKILFHIYVDPYDWGFWGCFPYQLCSVPMYLSLFCAFCKRSKPPAVAPSSAMRRSGRHYSPAA